jgi:hypothetical protein
VWFECVCVAKEESKCDKCRTEGEGEREGERERERERERESYVTLHSISAQIVQCHTRCTYEDEGGATLMPTQQHVHYACVLLGEGKSGQEQL